MIFDLVKAMAVLRDALGDDAELSASSRTYGIAIRIRAISDKKIYLNQFIIEYIEMDNEKNTKIYQDVFALKIKELKRKIEEGTTDEGAE